MASIDDFEMVSAQAKKTFWAALAAAEVDGSDQGQVFEDYIDNALRLYLSVPSAAPYDPRWIPTQYGFFGYRVARLARRRERIRATLRDFVEAIRRCGIVFVCDPPGPNDFGDRPPEQYQ